MAIEVFESGRPKRCKPRARYGSISDICDISPPTKRKRTSKGRPPSKEPSPTAIPPPPATSLSMELIHSPAPNIAPVHPHFLSEKMRNLISQYSSFYLQSLAERRPDLKGLSKMEEHKLVLKENTTKIGALDGINPGAQFFSRAELCVIGLHKHWLNGISFVPGKKGADPTCVSIVMSGGYEDDDDLGKEVTYTGQGGNNLTGDRKQFKDQEMKSGNLALKCAVETKHPVRVIRGHNSANSYTGRVYTYDGLYQVVEWRAEKGRSGFVVFKYRLERLPGQPELTTEQVSFVKGTIRKTTVGLPGLVAEDISNGQEVVPVHAVNQVDDPPVPPSGFTYTSKNVFPKEFVLPAAPQGCSCKGVCPQGGCACARRNGGELPYVYCNKTGVRLMRAKSVVYECGPNCSCGPHCVNRAVQNGIRFKLEVFKTHNKGWAVRSWDSIPAGAPICEYTGVLLRTDEADQLQDRDAYIFGLDCLKTALGKDGRQPRCTRFGAMLDDNPYVPGAVDAVSDEDDEFVVDAQDYGSVARFVNHSCAPNLFVQCVFYDHDDIRFPHIWLFAGESIPPLTELTYDYGYEKGSVVVDGVEKVLMCHCGSADCRERMY